MPMSLASLDSSCAKKKKRTRQDIAYFETKLLCAYSPRISRFSLFQFSIAIAYSVMMRLALSFSLYLSLEFRPCGPPQAAGGCKAGSY